jgi:predicted ABC-type ATPase
MPNIDVIGGANESVKTTVACRLLPNFFDVFEYINANEIASGLSPFNPELVVIQAGKLMLGGLDTLVQERADFAFETT